MKLKNFLHKCIKTAFAAVFTAGFIFAPAVSAAENGAVEAAGADKPAATAASNPIVHYEDIPTLQQKLGFPVLYLPGDIYRVYDPAVIISAIGGRVSDLRFISHLDNSELMVRTALRGDSGLDDISGYYGYEWEMLRIEESNLLTIDVCKTPRDTFAARWIAGNFAFAIAMDGIDYDAFLRISRSFFNASMRFAARFSKLKTAAPEE